MFLLNQEIWFGALLIFIIWLVAITLLVYFLFRYYRRLTRGTEKGTLGEVLEKIIKEQRQTGEVVETLVKKTTGLEEQGKWHLQKVGLVRFNPFRDTGGDHSFTLAVLDGKKNGLVISSLHSRDNTRIYAKPIKEGKAVGYQLSQEENEAIKKACQ